MAVWWRRFSWLGISVAIVLVPLGRVHASGASTTPSHSHHHRRAHHRAYSALSHAQPLRGGVLEDADTGQVLYQLNPEMEWPPASMAKMMLLLVASEQIQAGRFSINQPVRISRLAASTGGTRLGLRAGDIHPLGELMKAALVRSANDAAVAVAETIGGGSVEGCVRLMNQQAAALGMRHTHYQTPDGLPPRPGHDVDVTDAYDLAILARALIHNTSLLRWSSQEQCLFDGEELIHNTNHLVGHFEGCDGLKTGFTYHAGFNLTATAKRGDLRLIAVVLGAPSNPERFRQAARLLEWGFDNFEKVTVLRRSDPLPVYVQVHQGPLIQPVAGGDVRVLVRKGAAHDIRVEYDTPPSVNGPLPAGARLGQVVVLRGGVEAAQVSALSPMAIGNPAQVINAASVGHDGLGLSAAAAQGLK